MQYGISVPNFAEYADPRTLADLARDAEAAGWDGFFLWDHILFDTGWRLPIADPWVALAAIAASTTRVRLGPLVTPLARRRPWKVARETVTLDHLTGGRLVLGVGLGYPPDAEFGQFGEETDDKVRARKLDEGLDILTGLWSGEPFAYAGEQYRLKETVFLPRPVQRPRIPIWVGGYWPNRAPFRRAARWDGVCPGSLNTNWDEIIPLADLRAALYIAAYRAGAAPYDVVVGGYTPGDDRAAGAAVVAPYAEAGVTWWIENIHGLRGPFDDMRERVRQGPPR
ncbi:MAG TPA: LLM class flavin-dependent oxidoreductase [Thermomicrobiales bacterium]|nr:LLM class flavin-dependent oxidoreductase [Thermomicrobiales bacterium]